VFRWTSDDAWVRTLARDVQICVRDSAAGKLHGATSAVVTTLRQVHENGVSTKGKLHVQAAGFTLYS
jgi:hypothetical protein